MKKRHFGWGQIASAAVLAVFVFLVLVPLWIMLVKSFKTPAQENVNAYGLTFPFNFENYSLAWVYVKDYIFNSLFVSLCCTVGTVALSAITAYGFSRYKFKGSGVLYMVIIALMMVPGILTLIPQYLLMVQFELVGNLWGVILPCVAGSLPFNVMLLCAFYGGIPAGLYDAMDIDGANKVRQFVSLTLPMAVPIVLTIALNTWIGTWNDLVWPTIILANSKLETLSVALNSFTAARLQETHSYGVAMAGYVIASLPLVILFAFTSKQFIGGLTSGAFKM